MAFRPLVHVAFAAFLSCVESRGGLLTKRSGRLFPAAKPNFGVVPPEARTASSSPSRPEARTASSSPSRPAPSAQAGNRPSAGLGHSSEESSGKVRLGAGWPSTNSSLEMSVSANDRSGKHNASAVHEFGKPKVYFLFLAVDKISNLKVWLNFFAAAPRSEYRALVHCKKESCKTSLGGTVMQVVPTVPSFYCTDLVSPMNQLLAQALQAEPVGHVMDKFAFVSDSTLPAKPFSEVYASLTSRRGCSFCLFPSKEWADIPASGMIDVVPKHHQWVTLDRRHAAYTVRQWSSGHLHDFMRRFHMNTVAYTTANNSFADGRNFGCLDEFWYMAAIWGFIHQGAGYQQREVALPDFAGGPIQVAGHAGWQGRCDTFVIWAKYLHTSVGTGVGTNGFARLYASLDASSAPHLGNHMRPGWWDKLSTEGMRSIRRSDFLFVRKFIDSPALADGASAGGDFATMYSRIVLR